MRQRSTDRWLELGMAVGVGIAGGVVAGLIARRRRHAHVARAITIRRPLEDVASMWHRLEPMSRFEGEVAVRFQAAPGGRGTEVHTEVTARPSRAMHLEADLRRFKQQVETGDLVRGGSAR